MVKIIGITPRLVDGAYKVSPNLIKQIVNNGAFPLIITPEMDLNDILGICAGFIIPGGVTWIPIDEEIIKYAIKHDKALLGICAGMQAICNINNFCGSSASDKTIPINGNKHQSKEKYVHYITITDNFLKNILKENKVLVNSRHNFTVTKEDYFVIDAYSEDGLIEAIHLPNNRFILGLQWHPEDLFDSISNKIFRSFIEACQNP